MVQKQRWFCSQAVPATTLTVGKAADSTGFDSMWGPRIESCRLL